jgi:hypothetical protein
MTTTNSSTSHVTLDSAYADFEAEIAALLEESKEIQQDHNSSSNPASGAAASKPISPITTQGKLLAISHNDSRISSPAQPLLNPSAIISSYSLIAKAAQPNNTISANIINNNSNIAATSTQSAQSSKPSAANSSQSSQLSNPSENMAQYRSAGGAEWVDSSLLGRFAA